MALKQLFQLIPNPLHFLTRLYSFFGRNFSKVLIYSQLRFPAIDLNAPLQKSVTSCRSKDCENRPEKCKKSSVDNQKSRRLIEGKINAILVNNSEISTLCEHDSIQRIITPKERWAYAIELYFQNIPAEQQLLRLSLKIHRGEVGILLADKQGNKIEERLIIESPSIITRCIDCTSDKFYRLFIRNTSPYGHSEIEYISADLITEKIQEMSTFPGFDNFEINKEDLLFWSDFYGTRASTEGQFMRSKWLEKQSSLIEVSWKNGLKLCLDPKSNTAKALIVSGYYEPYELTTFQFLASILETSVDIGANIGIYALTAAITNRSRKVYAIEPSNRERRILQKSVNLNQISNLEILDMAIGEFNGPITLQIAPPEIGGHNQITNDKTPSDKQGWNYCEVLCERLDSIRSKINKRIDLIKIDVEGHELSVLKGAISTLENDTPCILLELTGGLWSNTSHTTQVLGLLQNYGYKLFDLDRKLGIWRRFSGWRSESNGNILCIHHQKLEVLPDINLHLSREFNSQPNPKYFLQETDLKILNPLHVFCHPSALAINEARMMHLDSINLSLQGKKILEVGGGIGLLTPYFLSMNCKVIFTDSRNENLAIAKQRLKDRANIQLFNLDKDTNVDQFENPDIVYCYGALYHLEKPAQAINTLASTKANIILLETCVNLNNNKDSLDFEKEEQANPNQASSGIGARPSRNWVRKELKKHWKYVYFTTTQPAYPDFLENWNIRSASNTRAILIGSNSELTNPFLTQQMPDHQNELEVEYQYKNFNLIEDLHQWLDSLSVNTPFISTLNDSVFSTLDKPLDILSQVAKITTFSPTLSGKTLICGRIKRKDH